MKIKTVKKMNLPELIEYVWENEVFPSVWRSEESPIDGWTIQFFEGGMFRSYYDFHDYDTFTVEVEEELTEETEFDELYEYYWDKVDGQGIAEAHSKKAIRGIIEEHEEETIPLSIMIRNKIDNHPVLIWTKEHGILEEGVLEVKQR